MTIHVLKKMPTTDQLLQAAHRFSGREDGTITIFACYMILIMLLVGGIGVDLMRHEMERTQLQAVSDRAVLAAADLDQTLDPESVVRDYFAKSGMSDYLTESSVLVQEGVNYRTVRVDAERQIQTQFMDVMGVEELKVPARSIAEERVPKAEISLVLDISGSMRFSSRMDKLRPAAQNFINTVMEGDAALKTSVTLVPYAGQTNPGPYMFNKLGGVRYPAMALDQADGGIPESQSHGILDASDEGGEGDDENVRYVYPNVSSCLDVTPSGFTNVNLPSGASYDQTAHFMNWKIASSVMDWGWCPQDQTAIKYMSNDATGLNNLIGSMRMHDGTGTHYAMKWAVAMLDPSSRDTVSDLIDAGLAPEEFEGRPSNYDDPETVKYIVLMTDGQITGQYRPTTEYWMDPENPTVELNEGRESERTTITSSGTNVNSFFNQCNLAKSRSPRGIVIYTIAFDAPGTPEQQMRDCASSPTHFFKADTSNIDEVFSSIARQINQLRLLQ